ncbi:hypothetical protein ABIA33_000274 [Streptacidiphilus sp. MAP12-16]|uniref:DUF3995 domain-containing protein n=1 Tax=Streptacidiphilus sp. MAP12-16 TaxID=3156300 RepID=UPI0035162DCF
MRTHTKGVVVATVLTVDAAIHLYWTTGATWPAASQQSLSQAVLNLDGKFTPPVLLPIAGLLLTGATLLLARANGRGGRPAALVSAAVAGGLAVRGAAGLVWITGFGADTSSPFYWLNLLAYTPACLTLAPLALSVARGDAAGVETIRRFRTSAPWRRSRGPAA